jgi:hypothetical protein
MSLIGKTVRIVVGEPWDWKNLFGTIISDRNGDKLLVKLTKSIEGKKLTSDLIELTPRFENTTFKPLIQNYSITINGSLKSPNSDELDFIIIGNVTID